MVAMNWKRSARSYSVQSPRAFIASSQAASPASSRSAWGSSALPCLTLLSLFKLEILEKHNAQSAACPFAFSIAVALVCEDVRLVLLNNVGKDTNRFRVYGTSPEKNSISASEALFGGKGFPLL